MKNKKHILTIYDKVLERYTRKTATLFSMAAGALEQSRRSFIKKDEKTARDIIIGDKEIDELNSEIHHESMTIIASFTPVSVDLRYVISLSRIANKLERLGDYAVNISKRVIKLAETPDFPEIEIVKPVFQSIVNQVREIAVEFTNGDRETIAEYLDIQRTRKDLASKLTEELALLSEKKGINITALAELIFISSNLEYIWAKLEQIEEEIAHLPFLMPVTKTKPSRATPPAEDHE